MIFRHATYVINTQLASVFVWAVSMTVLLPDWHGHMVCCQIGSVIIARDMHILITQWSQIIILCPSIVCHVLRLMNTITTDASLCHAASDGFSLTSLYVDTSDPAYMVPGATGQKRLRSLCAKLEDLSDNRCRQLLQALVSSCELVVGGPQAVKEDLTCIKVGSRATVPARVECVLNVWI